MSLTATEQIAELIEESSKLNQTFTEKDAEIEKRLTTAEQKVDDEVEKLEEDFKTLALKNRAFDMSFSLLPSERVYDGIATYGKSGDIEQTNIKLTHNDNPISEYNPRETTVKDTSGNTLATLPLCPLARDTRTVLENGSLLHITNSDNGERHYHHRADFNSVNQHHHFEPQTAYTSGEVYMYVDRDIKFRPIIILSPEYPNSAEVIMDGKSYGLDDTINITKGWHRVQAISEIRKIAWTKLDILRFNLIDTPEVKMYLTSPTILGNTAVSTAF
jgi:hypothetical protein